MQNLSLRFTPTAWAKLLYLRDRGMTEVGGFGISDTHDWLLVTDIALVTQRCSMVSVQFDDAAVADFFDRQVDAGLLPSQFARIWIHTHPGNSAVPSSVDEETFVRVFGHSDWAVMFILAQGGQTYCRLQLNAGPTGSIEIPICVDYSQPFAASDHSQWEVDYLAQVQTALDAWLENDLTEYSDRRPLIGMISDIPDIGDQNGFENEELSTLWEREDDF